jgi:hypothetical protein
MRLAVLAVALAVSVAACSGTPASTTTNQTGQPTQTTSAAEPSSGEADANRARGTTTQPSEDTSTEGPYPIVDTGQTAFYGNTNAIAEPTDGDTFSNQDASYTGNQPSYTDNGDGTITDNVTGLMWAQTPIAGVTFDEASEGAESFTLAGYDDWRLPTIKEMYSLILFTGTDPSGCETVRQGCDEAVPFIDTNYFNFSYGDESAGERMIDAQYVSSTMYAGDGFGTLVFGVNLADGRIKGYPLSMREGDKTFEVLYVRGTTSYGINDFTDNGDGTITDRATGLTWTQQDSGEAMEWEEALAYCSTLDTAGVNDWRLPNVKELQSIVDYTRSPSTTGSAAISPLFTLTEITDEGGGSNYPFLWSSTTHVNLGGGGNAAYVAFGEALGWMQQPGGGDYTLLDVHGAGAQRSDPKTGDASDYPYGHGPQGDVKRIDNYALCVSG